MPHIDEQSRKSEERLRREDKIKLINRTIILVTALVLLVIAFSCVFSNYIR